MPIKIPYPYIPPLPSAPTEGAFGAAMGTFMRDLEVWRDKFQSQLLQDWKTIESLPRTTFGRTTAALTLTSAFQAVPSLLFSLNVPLGGNVYVNAILDLDVASTVLVDIIGHLRVTFPNGTLTTQDGEIKFFEGASTFGKVRLNIGNHWYLTDLSAGQYTFQIVARDASTNSTTFVSTNSGMFGAVL